MTPQKAIRNRFLILGCLILFFVFGKVVLAASVSPDSLLNAYKAYLTPKTTTITPSTQPSSNKFPANTTESSPVRYVAPSVKITNAQFISAFRSLITSGGLPEDIKKELKGEQGPAGRDGANGTSYTFSSSPPPIQNNAGAVGVMGGFASLGVQDLNTKIITVTGNSTLQGSLSVAGATNLSGTLGVTGMITGNLTGNVTGSIDPSFTLGSIAFQGASGLTQDNANFFWDDTNNRLGIGTTSPDPNTVNTKLNIYGDSSSAVALDITGNTADADSTRQGDLNFSAASNTTGTNGTRIALIRSATAGTTATNRGGNLQFFTKSDGSGLVSRMIIKNDGSVGIGTTNPGSKLQIDGGHLTFGTDNTYDIGASGATRPRTGYFGTSVVSGIIDSPSATNLIVKAGGNTAFTVSACCANIDFSSVLSVARGAITSSSPVYSGTETWNSAGVSFIGTNLAFTETASAAGSRYLQILGGVAGATDEFYVQKGGVVYNAGGIQFITDNTVDIGASGATRPRTIYVASGIYVSSGGATNNINLSGRGYIGFDATPGNVTLQGMSSKGIAFNVNNDTFGSGNVWNINTSGHFLAATDNTYDIGASGATRPRTGYFGTSLISPYLIGGSSTTSDLFLQTTSGVGDSGADMHFLVGNAGGTEAMTILNSGNVGIGTTNPTNRFTITYDNTNKGFMTTTSDYANGSTGTQLIIRPGAATGDTYHYISSTITGGSAAGNLVLQPSGGNIGIGTTTTASLLTVGSGTPTTASSGLNFGTDTSANLYRSAAGTIKTDGAFVVTGAITVASCSGCSASLSQLTAATSTNTIANGANAQVWNWDSLTTGNAMTMASSSATTGSVLNLATTGTAADNNQKVLNISSSGANASASKTTYGIYSANTKTGSGTNVAGYFSASGGTNNYAGIFENGFVGIGTTSPAELFHIKSTGGNFYATGGTITESGGYTIHTFTSTGTFTVIGSGTVEYLVVAGGGAGGSGLGGGGGGGGVKSGSGYSVTAQAYTITIGNGGTVGAAPSVGGNGGNSTFDTITATGGGGGSTNGGTPSSGGSGGGASTTGQSGGAASPAGQGNAGGSSTNRCPSGGGGAGAAGTNNTGTDLACSGSSGGNGIANSITGTSVIYGGGGGGGGADQADVTDRSGGAGGSGGGGAGGSALNGTPATAGTANTGGGGGGGGYRGGSPFYYQGAAGGKGVVIIKYATPGVSDLVFTSSGKLGIGTTSPGAPLEIKGVGTGGVIAKFTDGNITGCLISTGGVLSCSSDQRLKKNIENINYGLSDLMKLRAVTYNWNSENEGADKSLGFIAQEVEQVFPKLVNTDENGYKQLNTMGLIPIITKSIQEINPKVESIESRINALEENTGENNSLGDYAVAFFNSGIQSVADGVVYMKNIVIEHLTIGSSENPTGFMIYDKVSKQPYCISMINGVLSSEPGTCEPFPEQVTPPPDPPAPTCTDGIQNQDETGIDTGGVCTPPPSDPTPGEVSP